MLCVCDNQLKKQPKSLSKVESAGYQQLISIYELWFGLYTQYARERATLWPASSSTSADPTAASNDFKQSGGTGIRIVPVSVSNTPVQTGGLSPTSAMTAALANAVTTGLNSTTAIGVSGSGASGVDSSSPTGTGTGPVAGASGGTSSNPNPISSTSAGSTTAAGAGGSTATTIVHVEPQYSARDVRRHALRDLLCVLIQLHYMMERGNLLPTQKIVEEILVFCASTNLPHTFFQMIYRLFSTTHPHPSISFYKALATCSTPKPFTATPAPPTAATYAAAGLGGSASGGSGPNSTAASVPTTPMKTSSNPSGGLLPYGFHSSHSTRDLVPGTGSPAGGAVGGGHHRSNSSNIISGGGSRPGAITTTGMKGLSLNFGGAGSTGAEPLSAPGNGRTGALGAERPPPLTPSGTANTQSSSNTISDLPRRSISKSSTKRTGEGGAGDQTPPSPSTPVSRSQTFSSLLQPRSSDSQPAGGAAPNTASSLAPPATAAVGGSPATAVSVSGSNPPLHPLQTATTPGMSPPSPFMSPTGSEASVSAASGAGTGALSITLPPNTTVPSTAQSLPHATSLPAALTSPPSPVSELKHFGSSMPMLSHQYSAPPTPSAGSSSSSYHHSSDRRKPFAMRPDRKSFCVCWCSYSRSFA